jgi:hypothetical protein
MGKYLLASAFVSVFGFSSSAGFAQAVTIEPDVDACVQEQQAPSVTMEKDVIIGRPLPNTVTLVEVPKYKKYGYAVVNKKRVIVDPATRNVIKVY